MIVFRDSLKLINQKFWHPVWPEILSVQKLRYTERHEDTHRQMNIQYEGSYWVRDVWADSLVEELYT